MSEHDELFKTAKPYDDRQRPVAVEFRDGLLLVTLQDGRLIGTPLEWYPRLAAATPEQRADVVFSTAGLHWEALDEDLGIEEMLLGIRPPSPQRA